MLQPQLSQNLYETHANQSETSNGKNEGMRETLISLLMDLTSIRGPRRRDTLIRGLHRMNTML